MKNVVILMKLPAKLENAEKYLCGAREGGSFEKYHLPYIILTDQCYLKFCVGTSCQIDWV